METTEAEAMKDVMNLLETEPPSESDHREQLAILVASGNCKEFLGVQLTQEQIKRFLKKDLEKYFKRYEASLSSKTYDAIVDTFIQLSCRGLAYFLPLDQEKLLNNMKKDFKPEKNDFQAPPIREMNSERRESRVGRTEINEEDLERLREEESKKDSKLKPMD